MKLKLIGYWVTTAALALETLAGGVTDLIHGGTELVAGQPVVQIVATRATHCTCSRSWACGRFLRTLAGNLRGKNVAIPHLHHGGLWLFLEERYR